MITLKEAVGKCSQLAEVLEAFGWGETAVSCERYGSGHINDTFLVINKEGDAEKKYILQRMNHEIFKDVDGLMNTVSGVTAYLRDIIIKEGGNPERETLNLVPDVNGNLHHIDSKYLIQTELPGLQSVQHN